MKGEINLKLTPRLKKIADFVPENSIVADIGTDHGYIPVYLSREKNIEKIIASDINEGPLNSAKEYVKKANLEDSIELRLGDGMTALKKGEVNTVIIAGMGGILISEIIERSKEICEEIDQFILQPMVGMIDLRKYLEENGYSIEDELLVAESEKMYQILYVKRGKEKISDEIYYEFSEKLIENKDPLLVSFLERKVEKINNIIKNIEKSGKTENIDDNNEKVSDLIKKRDKLLGVLNDAVESNN